MPHSYFNLKSLLGLLHSVLIASALFVSCDLEIIPCIAHSRSWCVIATYLLHSHAVWLRYLFMNSLSVDFYILSSLPDSVNFISGVRHLEFPATTEILKVFICFQRAVLYFYPYIPRRFDARVHSCIDGTNVSAKLIEC